MKKIKFYLILLISPLCGTAQNWAPLGNGLEYAAFSMFADSVDNRLYIGGNFRYAFNSEDTVRVNGITAWDGNKYVALGEGNAAGNCLVICPPIRGIARFQDEIYADLQDVPSGDDIIYGIARWNGERWDSLQGGVKTSSGFAGEFYSILSMEEEILVGGLFRQAGELPANGLAIWNGNTWKAFDFPGRGFDSRICCLSRLGNDIYAAGNFIVMAEEGETKDIARFDGEKWHAVDGGIKGGLAHINAMLVFQGQLYVAGFFRQSDGNAGNKVMKLGNSGWEEVGGGIIGSNADVHAMAIHNGGLYVGGIFDQVGDGVPAQNFARWDGQRWCGFGNSFSDRVYALASLNGDLFVAGWFGYIDGKRFNGIAKWTGGDYTADCGSINRTESLEKEPISIFPNPATHTLHLGLNSLQPEGAVLAIQNAAGQLLHREELALPSGIQHYQVDVSGWPPGVYFLRLQAGERQVVLRFVKTGTG